MTTMDLPPVLTLKEVADVLRINRTTLWRMLKEGRGPRSFRVGSEWRFRADEVRRFTLGGVAE